MMDPNKKEEEEEEEIVLHPLEIITSTENEKCCVDCKTTKTPLWRSGPAGPKSLCNACGIRYRKIRAATPTSAMGLNKEEEKIKKEKEEETSVMMKKTKKKEKRANFRGGKCGKLSVEWRQRSMAVGQGVVLFQRQRSPILRKRQMIHSKLGEVEQAALLLMALSCGSVFA